MSLFFLGGSRIRQISRSYIYCTAVIFDPIPAVVCAVLFDYTGHVHRSAIGKSADHLIVGRVARSDIKSLGCDIHRLVCSLNSKIGSSRLLRGRSNLHLRVKFQDLCGNDCVRDLRDLRGVHNRTGNDEHLVLGGEHSLIHIDVVFIRHRHVRKLFSV